MKRWLTAKEQEKRYREKVRQKLLLELDSALSLLHKKYNWTELYIYGSIQIPHRFRIESDIDIGVGGLKSTDLYRFVADLSETLERNVDIQMLEECRFARKIRNVGKSWQPITR